MSDLDPPDLDELRTSILDRLERGGMSREYRLELGYHPDRDIIALELRDGPDAFEVHELYGARQSAAEIAGDILEHHRST